MRTGRWYRSLRGQWRLLRRLPLALKLALPILTIELFLQIVLYDWRPPSYYRPAGHFEASRFYAEDPELFWTPADNFRRAREQITATQPRQRLYFFGGSVVFGFLAERNFPDYFQDRLRADPARHDLEVINLAFVGYSSQQSKILAQRIVPQNPGRLIFVSHGSNDIMRMNLSDRQVAQLNRHWSRRVLYGLMHSKLFALYRKGLLDLTLLREPWIDDHDSGVPRVSPDEFRENLLEYVDLAQQDDMDLVFMTQVNQFSGNRQTQEPYWRIMAELAAANSRVHYLDVRPFIYDHLPAPAADTMTLDPGGQLFKSSCHFNDAGNNLVGGWLYDELTRRGLLD